MAKRYQKTDFRQIVSDRMAELEMNAPQLAEASTVSLRTLYDFLRGARDDDDRKRQGTLNSAALALVFDALDLEVVARKKNGREGI